METNSNPIGNEDDQFMDRNLVSLSAKFDLVLQKMDAVLPSKDKQQIYRHYLTPLLYWWIIDVIYFSHRGEHELAMIKDFRERDLQNKPSKNELALDDNFILKTRKLVSEAIGSKELQIIQSADIDSVISYWEQFEQSEKQILNSLLANLQQKIYKDQERELEEIKELKLPLFEGPCSKTFRYLKFEQQVVRDIKNKYQKFLSKSICDICLQDGIIARCSQCGLSVHHGCYPKIEHTKVQTFQCDNCEFGLDGHTPCEICPILGGPLLRALVKGPPNKFQISELAQKSQVPKVVISRVSEKQNYVQNQSQEPQTFQFVHLTCYMCQPKLQYNHKENYVHGLHYIEQKKNYPACAMCGFGLGLIIECSQNNCKKVYHPECVKDHQIFRKIIFVKDRAMLDVSCEKHQKQEVIEQYSQEWVAKFKDIKKFFEVFQEKSKRFGMNPPAIMPRKRTAPQNRNHVIPYDSCMVCGEENDYSEKIINCSRCYDWSHEKCSVKCLKCMK